MSKKNLEIIDTDIMSQIFLERKGDAHKSDFGHLLVIGGSRMYSGSPALSAWAAYRSGVDLVTVAAPRRAADIVAGFSPDLITYPLEGEFFSPRHSEEVLQLIEGKDAVVIGGGIGRREETLEFVREILSTENLPIVIDADAIYALVGNHHLLKEKKFVLTPHAYEFQVLVGEVPPDDFEEKVEEVARWALELTSTVVLKGQVDIVSDGQRTVLNRTGNPFMTVGGTGDTLAGLLGSFLAQGVEEFAAACGAAYVNGVAGDFAAAHLGPALCATDLIDFLPEVYLDYLGLE